MSRARLFQASNVRVDRWVKDVAAGILNLSQVRESVIPHYDAMLDRNGFGAIGRREVFQPILDTLDLGEEDRRWGTLFTYDVNVRNRVYFEDNEGGIRLPRFDLQPVEDIGAETLREDEGFAYVRTDDSTFNVYIDGADRTFVNTSQDFTITGDIDFDGTVNLDDATISGIGLDELDDVDTSGKASGALIEWNGSTWVDVTPASMANDASTGIAIGNLNDVNDAISPVTGDILQWDSGSMAWTHSGVSAINPNEILAWNGSDWVNADVGTTISDLVDHSRLLNLNSDDHTHYYLADGTRAMDQCLFDSSPTVRILQDVDWTNDLDLFLPLQALYSTGAQTDYIAALGAGTSTSNPQDFIGFVKFSNPVVLTSSTTADAEFIITTSGTDASSIITYQLPIEPSSPTRTFANLEGNQTYTGLPEFSNASGIKTDDINERSANAGVTIDGVLLKDGEILLNADNDEIKFGAGSGGDAAIYYNGSNLVIDPAVIGTGVVDVRSGGLYVTGGVLDITIGDIVFRPRVEDAEYTPSTGELTIEDDEAGNVFIVFGSADGDTYEFAGSVR